MVVVAVLGSLVLLLTAVCVWEARTDRPEWRPDARPVDPAVRKARARAAQVSAVVLALEVGGGGGDGA